MFEPQQLDLSTRLLNSIPHDIIGDNNEVKKLADVIIVVGVPCIFWKSKFWRPNPFQIPDLQSSLSLNLQHKQIHKTPFCNSIKN